jgi:hypothetical protein
MSFDPSSLLPLLSLCAEPNREALAELELWQKKMAALKPGESPEFCIQAHCYQWLRRYGFKDEPTGPQLCWDRREKYLPSDLEDLKLKMHHPIYSLQFCLEKIDDYIIQYRIHSDKSKTSNVVFKSQLEHPDLLHIAKLWGTKHHLRIERCAGGDKQKATFIFEWE